MKHLIPALLVMGGIILVGLFFYLAVLFLTAYFDKL